LCTSQLSIVGTNPSDNKDAGGGGGGGDDGGKNNYLLSCPFCEWTSLDVDIDFEKPNRITEQLLKYRKHGKPLRHDDEKSSELEDVQFRQLTKFYKTQLSESDAMTDNPLGFDPSFSSPANLARIIERYGNLSSSSSSLRRNNEKLLPMREALNSEEGLRVLSPTEEKEIISQMEDSEMTTSIQRQSHPWNYSARFVKDLWPVPTALVTRKSKRCSICRHILIRHEDRKTTSSSSNTNPTSSTTSLGSSIKYKIRLLAQNHIPRLSIRPFSPNISASTPLSRSNFALTPATYLSSLSTPTFTPGQVSLHLLTITNPLFEMIRVKIDTPALTPGRRPHKVNVLCRNFEIGPDGDIWDSALSSSTTSLHTTGNNELAGGNGQKNDRLRDGEEKLPEVGRVWERGRNWVGVVVEIIPASLVTNSEMEEKGKGEENNDDNDYDYDDYDEYCRNEIKREKNRSIDDNVLSIPVSVTAEWEVDVTGDSTVTGMKQIRETRDIKFWTMLELGLSQDC